MEIDPSLRGSVVSDEQRLGQILKNLLSNAFKFTHQGEVKLSIGHPAEDRRFITESLRSAPEVIEFTVSDTGVGIPDEKLNLIFEAFQQADGTTSRKYGGTGLGLSISREIARLLGGEIHVESTVGSGRWQRSARLWTTSAGRPVWAASRAAQAAKTSMRVS